jgi:hypothetical protein
MIVSLSNVKNMKTISLIVIVMIVLFCYISSITDVYAICTSNAGCDKAYSSPRGSSSSPIIISSDTFSPSSQIRILIHAPDFNSNSYAIDTIGVDGSKVVISTRESSIPYMLVETGPDTGDFMGYVTLSSTTSTCSTVCGPTDGFLAAGGDDAVTVSLIYPGGSIISNTSSGSSSINHYAIPEFPFVELALLAGMTSLLFFYKIKFMKYM